MSTSIDHSKQHYVEAFRYHWGYRWKIYHYDASDNREIILKKSDLLFDTKKDALDDDWETWAEENNIDVEIQF